MLCLQVYYKAGGVLDVTPFEKQLSIIKYVLHT